MKTKHSYFVILLFIIPFNCFSQDFGVSLAKGKDASSKEDYNLALYYFNKAIESDPNSIEAFLERAHANNMIGNYQESLKDYNFVIKKESNNARAYFGLGSISETWLNDNYKAIEYYSKVIDFSLQKGDKEFAGTGYFMRAGLKAKLNDKKGYIEDLKKGTALNHSSCKQLLELETMLNKL